MTIEKHKTHSSRSEDELYPSKEYFGLTFSRWIILSSSVTLLLGGLIFCVHAIVTYSGGYEHAIIVTIVNKDVLSVIFCASILSTVTALIGIFAVQRKDRHLLACHSLLLWPCLALLTTVGYIAYKDTIWDLKTMLGMKWRYDISLDERFQLQENLRCCGFENSSDHAMYKPGSSCTRESLLQGCHEKLYKFESHFLVKAYSICFGLVPIQILVIIVALCYSRPSMPWLGRFYGNTPSIEKSPSLRHSHDASSKPVAHCTACENWTF